jgi:hypothetical protein
VAKQWTSLVVKRVLIGCEFSGTIREAFARLGFDAWSVDYEPSEIAGQHIEDDVLNVACRGHWDLLIAHPPCTDLAVSGAWLFEKKGDKLEFALQLVRDLMAAPIEHIAIENPVSIISTRLRKPNQIIQPWWFGHDVNKSTCLWLKNLPLLRPTNPTIAFGSMAYEMSQHRNRPKERSRTYPGVAKAMAEQWGRVL